VEAVGHRGARLILGGGALFVAENLVLSENRSFIIERFGNEGYHWFYGSFSTAATAMMGTT
jgi:hypothetical protein